MESSRSKSPTLTTLMGSNAADVVKLAGLLKAFAPHDGTFDLRVPGVHVVRRSKVYTELVHGMLRPSLCIVAQGAKRVMLGKETYEYDESRLIAVSVDLPVAAQVVRATPAAPFLGLTLDLDPHKVAELVLKVYPDGLPRAGDSRAVLLGEVTASIVVAATRLVELIGQPGDDLLGPLMIDEILIRLLLSPIGARIAQIGMADSGVDGVARAVAWLRQNFAEPMKVEELAALAHMSVSSFHQHFKAVTSMSPLQYQKTLRLQEARRLMLAKMMDAGIASRNVGYASASQFSREYGRYFGAPPAKDVNRLRGQAGGTAVE